MLLKTIVYLEITTYVCFLKWQHPGKPPERKQIKKMVTTAITKGKQNKVVGKMPASRVGHCADVTIKENNTTYYQGPKKQPSPLKEPGCRSVLLTGAGS